MYVCALLLKLWKLFTYSAHRYLIQAEDYLLSVCSSEVEKCDIFICLLGQSANEYVHLCMVYQFVYCIVQVQVHV